MLTIVIKLDQPSNDFAEEILRNIIDDAFSRYKSYYPQNVYIGEHDTDLSDVELPTAKLSIMALDTQNKLLQQKLEEYKAFEKHMWDAWASLPKGHHSIPVIQNWISHDLAPVMEELKVRVENAQAELIQHNNRPTLDS